MAVIRINIWYMGQSNREKILKREQEVNEGERCVKMIQKERGSNKFNAKGCSDGVGRRHRGSEEEKSVNIL